MALRRRNTNITEPAPRREPTVLEQVEHLHQRATNEANSLGTQIENLEARLGALRVQRASTENIASALGNLLTDERRPNPGV